MLKSIMFTFELMNRIGLPDFGFDSALYLSLATLQSVSLIGLTYAADTQGSESKDRQAANRCYVAGGFGAFVSGSLYNIAVSYPALQEEPSSFEESDQIYY